MFQYITNKQQKLWQLTQTLSWEVDPWIEEELKVNPWMEETNMKDEIIMKT